MFNAFCMIYHILKKRQGSFDSKIIGLTGEKPKRINEILYIQLVLALVYGKLVHML